MDRRAIWESLLELLNPIVRYVPTLLIGLATPLGIVALLGISTPVTGRWEFPFLGEFCCYSCSFSSDSFPKEGSTIKLEIDERYDLYLESFKVKLRSQFA